MRYLRATLTFVAAIGVYGDAEAAATYIGWSNGKRFVVTVTDERLRLTPSWKKDAENPPVGARDAMKRAGAIEKKIIEQSRSGDWELESLSLAQNPGDAAPDKWYWVVRYQGHIVASASTGSPPDLYIVVLMDYTVIEPVITKGPR